MAKMQPRILMMIAIYISGFSIENNRTLDLLRIFHFSCRILDAFNAYDKHLKSKDADYDLIIRSVKMVTNFARTG